MATMTRRAHLYQSKHAPPAYTTRIFDINNMVDDDDNSYGYTSNTASTDIDINFIGFDFSSLPDGSIINSMYVTVKATTGQYVNLKVIDVSYWENNSKKTFKVSTSSTILAKNNSTPTIVTFSNLGTWSLSELKKPYDASNYSGFGIRLEGYRLSGSGGKSVKIYYVDLTVDYTPPQYTISTAVNPSGSGSVSGGGTYDSGSTVTLTATPASGYRFVRWSDNNTSATRSVTVSGNATYTAYFERDALPEPDITNITFQPNRVQASQYAVVTVTMENIT